MIPQKNSKEVIYQFHNTKSFLNGVKKIHMKRRSNDVASGTKLCLYKSNSNSNTETADTNNKLNSNEKKICIKFKDLVAEEKDDNDKDDEKNFELALLLKRRRYTKNPKKIYKCNNKINLGNEKEKEEINKKQMKISKSMGKFIIDNSNDNTISQKIKKKLLCCH